MRFDCVLCIIDFFQWEAPSYITVATRMLTTCNGLMACIETMLRDPPIENEMERRLDRTDIQIKEYRTFYGPNPWGRPIIIDLTIDRCYAMWGDIYIMQAAEENHDPSNMSPQSVLVRETMAANGFDTFLNGDSDSGGSSGSEEGESDSDSSLAEDSETGSNSESGSEKDSGSESGSDAASNDGPSGYEICSWVVPDDDENDDGGAQRTTTDLCAVTNVP